MDNNLPVDISVDLTEVTNKVYDDTISPPAKSIGNRT